MNRMKKFRIIALMLVLLLSLSSFAPVTFGASSASRAELTQESTSFLLAIGAIKTDYTGKDYITTMKRKDMAAILADLILVNHVMPKPSADPAADVTVKNADLAYDVYIMTAYDIMPNDENGKFRPEEFVTYGDVKYAFASLLGYINYAKATGIGMAELNKLIAKTDIFDNVSYVDGNFLTIADFLIMYCNAIDEEMIYQTLFSKSSVEFDKNTDVTMMEEYLNITEYEGMVTANKHTSIFEPTGLDEDKVLIEGYLVEVGNTNVADYIGSTVSVYVYEDPVTEKGKVILADYASEANVLTISAEDVISDSNSFSLTNVVYADEKGKIKSARVSKTANYFYNGRMCDLSVEDFDINNGTVTLIANDGSSTYDVVKIETYENYIVDSVYESDDTALVYAKPDNIGEQKVLDLSENGEDGIRYVDLRRSNGRVVKPSQLKPGNVVSAYVSKDGGYVKAMLSSNVVEGEINGVDESDVRTVFKINGIDYPAFYFGTDWSYAGSAYADMYPRMGTEGEFYIDASGYIAYINIKTVTTKYGLLTGIIKASTMSSDVTMQVVTEEGSVVEIPVPEKGVKINNYDGRSEYTKHADLYDLLYKNDQLIQYSVTDNGELKRLNLAQSISDVSGAVLGSYAPSVFTHDYTLSSGTYNTTYKNFGSNMVQNFVTSTKMFMIKSDYITSSTESGATKYDIDAEGVYITSQNKIKDRDVYTNILYYDFDEAFSASVLVATVPAFDSTKSNAEQKLYVFDEMTRKLDEHGDEVLTFTLWERGKTKVFRAAEDIRYDALKKGDAAAIYLNTDGEITKIRNMSKELAPDPKDIEAGKILGAGDIIYNGGGAEELSYGYVARVYMLAQNGEKIVYTYDLDGSYSTSDIKTMALSSPVIYEVKSEDRDVVIKTSSLSLIPNSANPDENSMIYVFVNQGRVYDVIIYR